MSKPVFVKIEGAHSFEPGTKLNNKETEYTCSVCEITGIRYANEDYVSVFPNRKNKSYVETCLKPVTKGEKKITYKLPVEYSAAELEAYQEEMVEEYFNIEKIERQKKAVESDFKAKIAASEKIINDCMKALRDKEEEREVDCTVKYHSPKDFMKQIIRDDTGDVILEDKMDDEDCTFLNQLENANSGNSGEGTTNEA